MLDFCGKHNILPDTEIIEAKQLNWAFNQLTTNKDGIRYVLDIKKSMQNKEFMV
jgi:D-arabinose 1-dehydrogenase-like Zn-dependent alcohol dehydrogenase